MSNQVIQEEFAKFLTTDITMHLTYLFSFQESAVCAVTTIRKLAEAMRLKDPRAASKRLENFQPLKAIDGYKA